MGWGPAFLSIAAATLFSLTPGALAQAAKGGDWTAKDFRFHTGEVAALKLHFTTLGDPAKPAVLVLHGTGGSGSGLLGSASFGGALFAPGAPLDARDYFIILPDAIGAGQSAKPSDGLRAKFPRYNYDDMVLAQYRLLTEGLGIRHLRLVLGNSMGGMHTWLWGEKYPGFMDALAPMASQPTAMSGRNWMLRRMLIESIKADPAYAGGDYTTEPASLLPAETFFAIATSGGTLAWQRLAPTRAAADAIVARQLAGSGGDANDVIYQWEASSDYDAAPGLERITAPLLAINSADDERNPPETGLLAEAMKRVANGRVFLIPASAQTHGHGTTGDAQFWKEQLRAFLAQAPRR